MLVVKVRWGKLGRHRLNTTASLLGIPAYVGQVGPYLVEIASDFWPVRASCHQVFLVDGGPAWG
jgi:hypothetical protein